MIYLIIIGKYKRSVSASDEPVPQTYLFLYYCAVEMYRTKEYSADLTSIPFMIFADHMNYFYTECLPPMKFLALPAVSRH